MCLTDEGKVFVWGGSLNKKRGDKKKGQLGIPTMVESLQTKIITKIDCGQYHSLALEDNGALYSWGTGMKGQCGHGIYEDVETPKKIKYFESRPVMDFVCGTKHTLALTKDNELYSWGEGIYGQCGYGEFETTATPQLVQFPKLDVSFYLFLIFNLAIR